MTILALTKNTAAFPGTLFIGCKLELELCTPTDPSVANKTMDQRKNKMMLILHGVVNNNPLSPHDVLA